MQNATSRFAKWPFVIENLTAMSVHSMLNLDHILNGCLLSCIIDFWTLRLLRRISGQFPRVSCCLGTVQNA